jgi:hypothetical protein
MVKKLLSRGQHTVLPLAGDRLVEISFSTASFPVLVFAASDGLGSELRVHDRIILRRGESEQVLDGAKPGETFNPKTLSPLLELLGTEVREAIAEKQGRLRLHFSNDLYFEVPVTGAGEAWQFQYPRPGRPYSQGTGRALSVIGAPGRLI